MKKQSILCLLPILLVLSAVPSHGSVKENNRRSYGLQMGDPIALTMRIPVSEINFIDIDAGIWAWHLYEDVEFNTVFLAFDYARMLTKRSSRLTFFAGAGVNVFFSDNPKDAEDYKACMGLRFLFGADLMISERLSIGFELAPFIQLLRPYVHQPYGIDQNGGIVIRFR
jgi:hypothetical protein